MQINAKYSNLLFAFLMSVLMALLMSGVLTAIFTGFSRNFTSHWMYAFVITCPIAFTTIMVIAPTLCAN